MTTADEKMREEFERRYGMKNPSVVWVSAWQASAAQSAERIKELNTELSDLKELHANELADEREKQLELEQQNEQLKLDNADLHKNIAESNTWLAEANDKNEQLQAQILRLRDQLGCYCDSQQWKEDTENLLNETTQTAEAYKRRTIEDFIKSQTQLPAEFQKVLHDNLWNLYEE